MVKAACGNLGQGMSNTSVTSSDWSRPGQAGRRDSPSQTSGTGASSPCATATGRPTRRRSGSRRRRPSSPRGRQRRRRARGVLGPHRGRYATIKSGVLPGPPLGLLADETESSRLGSCDRPTGLLATCAASRVAYPAGSTVCEADPVVPPVGWTAPGAGHGPGSTPSLRTDHSQRGPEIRGSTGAGSRPRSRMFVIVEDPKRGVVDGERSPRFRRRGWRPCPRITRAWWAPFSRGWGRPMDTGTQDGGSSLRVAGVGHRGDRPVEVDHPNNGQPWVNRVTPSRKRLCDERLTVDSELGDSLREADRDGDEGRRRMPCPKACSRRSKGQPGNPGRRANPCKSEAWMRLTLG